MSSPAKPKQDPFFTWPVLLCLALVAIVLWWFYSHLTGFGGIERASSVIGWMTFHWHSDDMEHGWLVPILSVAMLYHSRAKLAAAPRRIDWRGIFLVILGALIYVAGYRVIQARVCIFALPVILLGCTWYIAGWRTMKICAIPLLFLWMMIPLILVEQATVGLQIIATELGNAGANLFGVDTYVRGTAIFSATELWDPYSISGGCSGMRSLMALTMISIVWAYMADLAVWKKLVLVACAVPLAVLGNAFRVASIVILAEYIDPSFASKTWHDWSGLLLFFPVTLMGLMAIHSLLAGEFILFGKKRRKTVIRQNLADTPAPPANIDDPS